MKNHFKFENYEPDLFEEHIRDSIPNYKGMRELIPSIASNFLVENTNIYDIGCSSGDLLIELEQTFKNVHDNLSYVGYDKSNNLLPNLESAPNCSFFPRDITDERLTMFNTSLVFSLFTLQFLPLDKRAKVVQKIYDSLDKRGAFIVCEKITAKHGIVEDIFTFSNYDMKYENGFTPHDILQKQADLRSIMFPLSQVENENMFHQAGFRVIEVFFKSLNFIGWVLIK